jgi:tetratricopeptide (TPR) repeat protein
VTRVRGPALAAALLLAACEGDPDAAAPPPASADVAPSPPSEESSTLDAPIERPQAGDRARALTLVETAHEQLLTGKPDEARATLEAAVAADPSSAGARVELGFVLLDALDEKHYGAALEQFRAARAIAPQNPLATCGEGIAREGLGDLDRAEPILRGALAADAVKRDPLRFFAASAALARIEAVRGRTDDAVRRFREAGGMAGPTARQRADCFARAAEALAQAARPADAEAELRRAFRLDPENLRGHYLRSQLLAKRGAAPEAAAEARIHEILRALADHTAKRYRLDGERRVALRRDLVEAWPEYVRARYELVRELLDEGRYAEAVTEIGALHERDAPNAESRALLARAKAGAGDLAGAKEAFDALRFGDPEVRRAFARDVLADWRRGVPGATEAEAEARRREWTGEER